MGSPSDSPRSTPIWKPSFSMEPSLDSPRHSLIPRRLSPLRVSRCHPSRCRLLAGCPRGPVPCWAGRSAQGTGVPSGSVREPFGRTGRGTLRPAPLDGRRPLLGIWGAVIASRPKGRPRISGRRRNQLFDARLGKGPHRHAHRRRLAAAQGVHALQKQNAWQCYWRGSSR
jgi:hypothetical protein